MNRYATLAQVRFELVVDDDQTVDDSLLVDILYFVSDRIEKETDHEFAPRIETSYLNALGLHIDDTLLSIDLDRPFLSITEVVDGGGVTLTLGTDYQVIPRTTTPITGLRRLDGQSWSVWSSNNWQDAISVTGITGWRKHYSEAWLSSGDQVENTGGIDASATSIEVSDIAGSDGLVRTPRFSAGQLIRVDEEFMFVLDTAANADPVPDTLTVIRAVNGSEAAAHAEEAAIDIWQPEPDIQKACMRWTNYLYARRGAFSRTTYSGVTTTEFPPDIPDDVAPILERYRDKTWGVVGLG